MHPFLACFYTSSLLLSVPHCNCVSLASYASHVPYMSIPPLRGIPHVCIMQLYICYYYSAPFPPKQCHLSLYFVQAVQKVLEAAEKEFKGYERRDAKGQIELKDLREKVGLMCVLCTLHKPHCEHRGPRVGCAVYCSVQTLSFLSSLGLPALPTLKYLGLDNAISAS